MAYYEFCSEHNGIEIYFDDRPDEEYLVSLRGNGWRWHRTKKCWYSYASEENEEFAEDICDAYNEEYGYDENEEENECEENNIQEISSYAISGNLIRCVDCGKNISSRASFCVNCGAPMEYIKGEYDKERIRQEKIREKEAKEKAERERLKQEAEKQRRLEMLLAEAERICRERKKREQEEHEKKLKERRIKDLKSLYIKDKDAFIARVCNERVFSNFECHAFIKGYKWKMSNGDGVEIEYDDEVKQMTIKYSEQNVENITDKKIIESICSRQKTRLEMRGIEDLVQELRRKELKREMELDKERKRRNGEYYNCGTVYTDSNGFVISRPHYTKK